MKIEDAYLKFLSKVERNLTNDSLAADRDRFVILFNEAQNKFTESIIERRAIDEVEYIQRLVVQKKPLADVRNLINSNEYKLPKDYFYFINLEVVGESDCGSATFLSWQVKLEDVQELLHDKFNKPSFDFRETFYTLGDNSVRVYRDDFNIKKVFLTYYRYPKSVDLEGYIKSDGSQSSNIDPEWDDKAADRIISICAKDFMINSDFLEKYQLGVNQITSKI